MRISKNIDTVFFDLDGTLLPMEAEDFTDAYFNELAIKAAPFGYDAKAVVSAVWAATKAMVQNDGSVKNIDQFWKVFCEALGVKAMELKQVFDGFYLNEFDRVRCVAKENPDARILVDFLKQNGYTLVLATNPLFPLDGNLTRMSWIGLHKEDFDYITSYENSSFCKPNPEYYRETLNRVGKQGAHAIMIGNNASEDLVASECGMDTFLVKDYLINHRNLDISAYKQGRFSDLLTLFGAVQEPPTGGSYG